MRQLQVILVYQQSYYIIRDELDVFPAKKRILSFGLLGRSECRSSVLKKQKTNIGEFIMEPLSIGYSTKSTVIQVTLTFSLFN